MLIKRKLKLSLIEDYIKIVNSKTICHCLLVNTNEEKELINSIVKKCNNLISCYEKLIFKLNLMDLSFIILKKELFANKNRTINNLKYNNLYISKVQQELILIEQAFYLKIKQLSLNEFEQQYISQALKVDII